MPAVGVVAPSVVDLMFAKDAPGASAANRSLSRTLALTRYRPRSANGSTVTPSRWLLSNAVIFPVHRANWPNRSEGRSVTRNSDLQSSAEPAHRKTPSAAGHFPATVSTKRFMRRSQPPMIEQLRCNL